MRREFYTGGTKLTLVPGDDAKMTAQSLRKSILAEETRGVHGPQRGPVSPDPSHRTRHDL